MTIEEHFKTGTLFVLCSFGEEDIYFHLRFYITSVDGISTHVNTSIGTADESLRTAVIIRTTFGGAEPLIHWRQTRARTATSAWRHSCLSLLTTQQERCNHCYAKQQRQRRGAATETSGHQHRFSSNGARLPLALCELFSGGVGGDAGHCVGARREEREETICGWIVFIAFILQTLLGEEFIADTTNVVSS